MRRLRRGEVVIAAPDEFFYALFKLASRQEHAVLAGGADDADVCAQSNNFPLIAAARMRLAQAHEVM
jgi:hypothetical protein